MRTYALIRNTINYIFKGARKHAIKEEKRRSNQTARWAVGRKNEAKSKLKEKARQRAKRGVIGRIASGGSQSQTAYVNA
jgi:hypothetical protein